ncbi:CynX/NimT family MFS transporter [Paenibacillus dendritiformis]|uniref:MFS transporter n=1 Tax=Paenibacillus dendritiformis TaxID=130049 RepID=UPI001F54ADE6|nr:MFS transporter [Paenibacillus dendritiformis]
MPFFYLILVIFFISINLRPAITSVGPLLDVIQTELGMNGMMASLMTTLPVFCMGLFALLAIRLCNRLGNELSLMIAMLLIFLATLARMFASSSILLLVTALFSGIGIGIAGPLMSGFIKKHFPDKLGVTGVYSVSMVIGAALTGKTLMSQRLLEKYLIPYFSIDHLKMGLYRGDSSCGFTPLDSDEVIGEKLWPIIKGMIMTSIENNQNMIIEGCYILPRFIKDFEKPYSENIISVFLGFSTNILKKTLTPT